jgi:endoglucanase
MAASSPRSRHRRVLRGLLALPTAPFAEHHVIDYVKDFCARRKHVTLRRDGAGNLLARVRKGRRRVKRPACITAHLDHPGFVADRMLTQQTLRANWWGGVPKEYFRGAKVRFYVAGTWVRGRVRSVKTKKKAGRERVETAVIDVRQDVPSGSVGMWDLPEPTVRGSRIYARPCDDLAGAAAMLCAIDELDRGRGGCDGYFLFTRAEEVGFAGAIAAARAKTIPAKCYVVAMETSTELPHVKMGAGPILRVGDRASTFTPAVTAHCHRVAQDLTARDKTFRFRRTLMDGGMCESSAYCLLGYEATGMCVALGNYHNVDKRRKKLGPEYIDLSDFDNTVKWFVALGEGRQAYTGRDEALLGQLDEIEQTYDGLLRSSTRRPLQR